MVNVILRRDFQGTTLRGNYGKTKDWDGRDARGAVGRSDLLDLGFSAQESLSGVGAITTDNVAGSTVNGNVRNPATLDYYNRGNLAGAGFTRTFPAPPVAISPPIRRTTRAAAA